MPYRFHKPSNDAAAEFFEPSFEPSRSALDIAEFIERLKEPERSICSAVILDGDNFSQVAAAHGTSSRRIGRIVRSALRPLAEDFGIRIGR